MMPRIAAAVALLLALPAASAGTILDMEVTKVEATRLDVTAADGALTRVHAEDFGGVVVNASYIRVEIDRRVEEVSHPIGFPPGQDPTAKDEGTEILYEGPASLRSTSFNPAITFHVHAAETETAFQTDALEVVPVDNTKRVTSQGGGTVRDPPPETSTNGSIQLQDPDGELRLRGGLLLAASGVNFTLETPDGMIDFWTGARRTSHFGVPSPVGYGDRKEYQFAYIFVEDGTLETQVGPASQLYLWRSTTKVLGSATVSGGELSRPTTVEGPVLMSLHGSGDGVNASFADIPPAGSGEPVEIPETPSSSPPARPAAGTTSAPVQQSLVGWSLAAAIGLVLVAVAAWRLHRHLAWRRLHLASSLGMDGVVIQQSRRFLGHRRHGALAAMMHASALLRTEGPDAAEAFLSDVTIEASMQHYIFACIRCQQGRWAEAREEADACLREEPAFRLEFDRNPMLRGLFQDTSDAAFA